MRAKRGNPVEVRSWLAGKPTVRKAQSLGGNGMTEKRMPAPKGNGKPGGVWPAPSELGVPDNRPDTGRRARTRKRADAVR